MIRERPSSIKIEQERSSNNPPPHKSIGTQTDEKQKSIISTNTKKHTTILPTITEPQPRQRKRAFMEIEILEKDIHEMNFRERRRALKQMRDAIYEEDAVDRDNGILRDYRPNFENVGYSKSDESIKLAIDMLKESDISTHIFLKHFLSEFAEIDDIIHPSELLDKELIQAMLRTVGTYKSLKFKQGSKQKLKLFNHTVEEVIYPSGSEKGYNNKISVNYMASKRKGSENVGERDSKMVPVIKINSISPTTPILNQSSNNNLIKKRNKFPSFMLKQNEKLNTINEPLSRSSISSKTSSESKTDIKDDKKEQQQNLSKLRPRQRNSLSLGEFNKFMNGIDTTIGIKNKVLEDYNNYNNVTKLKTIDNLESTSLNNKKSLPKIINKQSLNSLSSTPKNTNELFEKSPTLTHTSTPKPMQEPSTNNGLKKARKKISTSYFTNSNMVIYAQMKQQTVESMG